MPEISDKGYSSCFKINASASRLGGVSNSNISLMTFGSNYSFPSENIDESGSYLFSVSFLCQREN